MKFKKVLSMLCVIAILAVSCVCGVMAEDSSFTLEMSGLTASDYNADGYTAVNNVVSLKANDVGYIATDSIKLAKGLQVIVKVTPIVDGEIKVTYEGGAVVVSADEKRGNDEAITGDTAYAVKGGETYYLLGNSSTVSKVTKITFIEDSNKSFELSMVGLTSSDYNADGYTAVNNVVSLKANDVGYIATDSIKLAKGLQVIVKVTPIVDGEIKVTYEGGAVVISADETRGSDESIASDTAYSVKGGETYYLLGNSSTVSKVTMITFTQSASSVEPTAEPAAVLTAVAGDAVASDETVTDGSVATGFTATVTNSGDAAGSFSTVNWTVTSNNVTKKATASYGTITLDTGADVMIGLIIKGLHDAAATAAVTVEQGGK